MKIKTLQSKLKKLNSSLKDNLFVLAGRKVKVLKNHNSDEFFSLALENGSDFIYFDSFSRLARHLAV